MQVELWKRVERLFAKALELPPPARTAFLDEHCAGDATLRAEIDALLRAHEATGILDRVAHVAPSVAPTASLAEGAGVGHWRIGHLLGRGGMGEVYAATRTDGGFEQVAALKLLRHEAVAHVERFHDERRILARLEHPGIARLLDGGLARDGRPYTVMEYVEGLPLTEYCRERSAGVRERIALFAQVCEAVAFAHRNLVIHRDLKPANILVDGQGRVKLLDFGIAKLIDAATSAEPGETTIAPFTPEYAAPEQLAAEPVTTATDTWALGVLLFELLAGDRPWRVTGSSPAHALGALRDRSAPPASRIARAGAAPPVPAREIEGDLDAIVARCLRPEPARRYASVDALRRDLDAHVRNEPVLAREGARLYVFTRFLRRHWLPATALAALVIALAGAAVYAQIARARAESALRQADTIRGFLIDMFALNDPEQRGGLPLSARELVDLGAKRAETALGDDPDTRIALLDVIGTLYDSLGESERSAAFFGTRLAEAEKQYPATDPRTIEARVDAAASAIELEDFARAGELLDQALAAAPVQRTETRKLRASALTHRGTLESARGEFARAIDTDRDAVALWRAATPAAPVELAEALTTLGIDIFHSGRTAEAEVPLREALAILEPAGNEATSELLFVREHLTSVLCGLARFDEARELASANVALVRTIYGPEHAKLANNVFTLARVERLSGESRTAARLYGEALAIYEHNFGDTHSYVATTLTGLGQSLAASGQHAEAIAALERADRIYLATLGPNHQFAASSATALADARLRFGDAVGAEAGFRTAIARYEASGNGDHIFVEAARRGLGQSLCDQQRATEGEPLLRGALARFDHEFGSDDYRTIGAATTLANCLAGSGQAAAAAAVLDDAQRALEAGSADAETKSSLLASLAKARFAAVKGDAATRH